MLSKRTVYVVGVLAAAFFAGAAVMNLLDAKNHLASGSPMPSGKLLCPQQSSDPAQMEVDASTAAAYVATTFAVNPAEVREAIEMGTDYRDIGKAAMLAQLSGRSFAEVLTLKTEGNSWHDVEQSIGVTRSEICHTMQKMAARRMARSGSIDERTALSLIQQGYEVQDIRAAVILARASGREIAAVLEQKKINNRWQDVATALGVTKDLPPLDKPSEWDLEREAFQPVREGTAER